MKQTTLSVLTRMHLDCMAAYEKAQDANNAYPLSEAAFAIGWLCAKGLDGDLAGDLAFNGGFGLYSGIEFVSMSPAQK